MTKLVVEKAEVKSQRYTIWDSELKGFGVKVQPSGRKSYLAYLRTQSGQQRKPAIGSHRKITTEEARQIAKKWIAASVSGVDVSQDRQEARAAPLIRDLAQKYLCDYAACFKKQSSAKSDKSNLHNHVLPLMGPKKASEVKRADIEDVKTAKKDGSTTARRKANLEAEALRLADQELPTAQSR